MSTNPWGPSRISYSDLGEAERRIDARFRPDWNKLKFDAVEAVDAVTLAVEFPNSQYPEVRVDDLADALLLLDKAREDLVRRADANELKVLDTLRAAGWTWRQIGEHLQYRPDVAAQRACDRYRRVRALFPGYQPRHETTPPVADNRAEALDGAAGGQR